MSLRQAAWIGQLYKEQFNAPKILVFEAVYAALAEIAEARETEISQILTEEIERMIEEDFRDFVPSETLFRKTCYPHFPSQPLPALVSGRRKAKLWQVQIMPRKIPINLKPEQKAIIREREGEELLNLLDIAEYAVIRILRSALAQVRKEQKQIQNNQ